MAGEAKTALRRDWTTGACAAAAARAAFTANLDAARSAAGAGEILTNSGDNRHALARAVAAQPLGAALATLSSETAVEVAIVDRQGDFLARVGG